MTNDQLKAMNARCEAATDGPWEVGDRLYDDGAVICRIDPGPCTPDEDGKIKGNLCNANYSFGNRENDNSFIAHARTDLPACLDEIERLKKLVKSAYREAGNTGRATIGSSCPFDKEGHFWTSSVVRKALEQE